MGPLSPRENLESDEAWKDDKVQFARLLCELVANNETLHLDVVAESMDLDCAQVLSLLDRAVNVWETAKGNTIVRV
jgi:arginine deiminase